MAGLPGSSVAEPRPDRPSVEFDATESQLIGDLARKMRFVGGVAAVLGALMVLFGIASVLRAQGALTPWLVIGEGMVFTAVGIWTRPAAMAFRFVAETTGRDIRHLMEALGELRELFNLQYWICLGGVTFFLIILLISLMGAVAR